MMSQRIKCKSALIHTIAAHTRKSGLEIHTSFEPQLTAKAFDLGHCDSLHHTCGSRIFVLTVSLHHNG